MNGQHVLFKPEPVKHCPLPSNVREKLAALREYFAAKAAQQLREAPHVFRPAAGR